MKIYDTHVLRNFRFIIGRNINRVRLERRMTLRKLAHITHISESRLDQFELGKNAIHLDELLKIACTFGIEVNELLFTSSADIRS